MKPQPGPRADLVAGVLVIVILAGARGPALAQAAPSALKAAFLLNFAKFAEWPALQPDATVHVCVSGDPLVANALADNLRSLPAEARSVKLVELPSDLRVRDCQVLFVTGGDAKQIASLLEEASTAPVLTVSDTSGFAETGGMVELFVEGGRMKFAVNVDAVQRSRIHLSSRLLGLARIVRDSHGP